MAPIKVDYRLLFDRFSQPGEQFDEEWPETMRQRVRDEGRLVGRNEWDSGGPGAGAGVNNVYVFTKLFFAEDDVGMFGPYQTFFEAADVVGLLSAGEATTSIWVSSEYRTEAEGAVTLFDGLSKAQASALFSR